MITEPNVNIAFKTTQEEKDTIKAAAQAAHKTVSQYIRDVLRAHIAQGNQ